MIEPLSLPENFNPATFMVAKVTETKTLLAKAGTDKVAAEKLLGELQTQKAAEEKKLNEVKTLELEP